MANVMHFKTKKDAVAKTALDICPPDPVFDPIRQLALIIAMMFEKSQWAHSGVCFEAETGKGRFHFKVGVSSICISGYNLAYQVKLCTQLLEDVGCFA